MGTNNYAEIITDPIKARSVIAQLHKLADEGRSFKVLQFNPETDQFSISLGRESNLPPLPEIEDCGTTLDGPTAKARWSSSGDTVEAINFGNGHVGLAYQSGGLGYMAIPAHSGTSDLGLWISTTEDQPQSVPPGDLGEPTIQKNRPK